MFPNKRKHYEIYFYICGCAYVALIASSPPLLLWSIFMREKAKPLGQKGSREISVAYPHPRTIWASDEGERRDAQKIKEKHTTMEKNQLH